MSNSNTTTVQVVNENGTWVEHIGYRVLAAYGDCFDVAEGKQHINGYVTVITNGPLALLWADDVEQVN